MVLPIRQKSNPRKDLAIKPPPHTRAEGLRGVIHTTKEHKEEIKVGYTLAAQGDGHKLCRSASWSSVMSWNGSVGILVADISPVWPLGDQQFAIVAPAPAIGTPRRRQFSNCGRWVNPCFGLPTLTGLPLD